MPRGRRLARQARRKTSQIEGEAAGKDFQPTCIPLWPVTDSCRHPACRRSNYRRFRRPGQTQQAIDFIRRRPVPHREQQGQSGRTAPWTKRPRAQMGCTQMRFPGDICPPPYSKNEFLASIVPARRVSDAAYASVMVHSSLKMPIRRCRCEVLRQVPHPDPGIARVLSRAPFLPRE